MNDRSVTRSHSSMNIENLTSIPVGGSITLIDYAHRQLPNVRSPSTDRGWAWVVCAGSFFVMFMVYGIHTSFGVLLVVLLDHFEASKASTGRRNFLCLRIISIMRYYKSLYKLIYTYTLELLQIYCRTYISALVVANKWRATKSNSNLLYFNFAFHFLFVWLFKAKKKKNENNLLRSSFFTVITSLKTWLLIQYKWKKVK